MAKNTEGISHVSTSRKMDMQTAAVFLDAIAEMRRLGLITPDTHPSVEVPLLMVAPPTKAQRGIATALRVLDAVKAALENSNGQPLTRQQIADAVLEGATSIHLKRGEAKSGARRKVVTREQSNSPRARRVRRGRAR